MKYALLMLIAIALPAPVVAALAEPIQDPTIKLLELEVRIDQLSRRVESLEARAQAGADPGPGARIGKDLTWHFDGYVGEAPFTVSQQEIDRKTGRVDVLLNLVAEPADGDLWRSAGVGEALPVEASATLSGGGSLAPVTFTLVRRASFEVGAHVHVQAQLPVADAKAVRRLAIRHRAPR